MKVYTWMQLALMSMALTGCAPKPQELPSAFEFTVGYRPAVSRSEQVRNLVGSALEGGGLALQDAEGPQLPGYLDLEFFPVLNDEQLDAVLDTRSRYSRQVTIEPIDFSRNFVLLVAVPGQSLAQMASAASKPLYFVTPKLAYSKDEVQVLLDASRLGGSGMSAADTISVPWEVHAYVLPRQGRKVLAVTLDGEPYRFSLEGDSAARRL
ncbi:MAG: hypothetical protein QM581_06885 [Pseudomonas sp.]